MSETRTWFEAVNEELDSLRDKVRRLDERIAAMETLLELDDEERRNSVASTGDCGT